MSKQADRQTDAIWLRFIRSIDILCLLGLLLLGTLCNKYQDCRTNKSLKFAVG